MGSGEDAQLREEGSSCVEEDGPVGKLDVLGLGECATQGNPSEGEFKIGFLPDVGNGAEAGLGLPFGREEEIQSPGSFRLVA